MNSPTPPPAYTHTCRQCDEILPELQQATLRAFGGSMLCEKCLKEFPVAEQTVPPAAPVRRIIQIAGASETEDRYQSLFALCDDGSVWRIVNRPVPQDCYWARFPAIPQD